MQKSYNMRRSYAMLGLIYFAGIAAPVNQFKVPPMMQQLMMTLDISLAHSGWLMSVFALVGLLFAIPAGTLLKKLGNKNFSMLAMCLLLFGSFVGTVSHTAPLMLASRVFEGMGTCMFAIAAPAAIAAYFPPGKRGMATGIWVTWVPMGTMIMYIVAPLLGKGGWTHVWYFASVYTALMTLLFALFFRMPDNGVDEGNSSGGTIPAAAFRNILLLAAVFTLFNTLTISLKSYYPLFLELVRGYAPVKASGVMNVMIIVSMFMGPLSGLISDKTGHRKALILAGCVLASLAVPVLFIGGAYVIVAALFLLGIACGNIASSVFAAPAEIAGVNHAGRALSIVVFGQYLGMTIGPVLFSTVVDAAGWFTAGVVIFAVIVAALICGLKLKIK